MLVEIFGESAITYRSALCAVLSFLISVLLFPYYIRFLKSKRTLENVEKGESEKLDKINSSKKETPTMGGLLVVFSIVISCALFADFKNHAVYVVLFVLVAMCSIGLVDDLLKVKRKKGLSILAKLLLQIFAAYTGAYFASLVLINQDPQNASRFFLPFDGSIHIGGFLVILIMTVTVISSNAVNITDGLDGLATGCYAIAVFAFSLICYIVGRLDFSQYLSLPHILSAAELTTVCAAMVGACLGFLWYNSYPAQIFMGDCGSLALGGSLGLIACFTKQEILLFVIGSVFMLETLSSLLQVVFYKLTKRRLFSIAPLHHSYQFKGMHEAKITIRFWIVGLIICVLALATLKIK